MRVLVLSDIHANLVALETVLEDARRYSRYDTVWCLGDVVGYGPKPNECIEIVREVASLCVMGNHDWAVLGREGINVDDFNPQARQAVLWTREELNEKNRAYLDQLAYEPVQPPKTSDIIATHASPREPVWEYILTPSIALENFAVFSESICLFGHTHRPAIFRWRLHDELLEEWEEEDAEGENSPAQNGSASMVTVDYLQPLAGEPCHLTTSPMQRLIINPGSVGQPRDNDARTAYAILDLERQIWHYRRVAYPLELTQGQMREAGLPRRLIDRLSFGW